MEVERIKEIVASRLRNEGIEEWALVVERRRSSMIKIANNVVTVAQGWNAAWMELYAAKEKKIGYVGSMVSDEGSVSAALEKLLLSLKKSEPSPIYGPLPRAHGSPLSDLVDPRIVEEPNTVLEISSKIVDEAQRLGVDRIAGTIHFGYRERYAITSTGFEAVQPSTFIQVYVRAFRDENSGHWAWGSTRFDEDSLLSTVRKASEFATLKLPRQSIDPGEYQAILSPLVVANLVNNLAFMASGMMVLMGASMFVKHGIGSKPFSDNFTLIDAPLEKSLPHARGFDDEGAPCTNKPIIERGIVRNLLHNAKTANYFNSETTGNAGLVMPIPWNLIVESGSADLDSLVKDVRRGFLVLNNWYTRMQNWIEGTFSTVSRDALIYIENGEFKALSKQMRIADSFANIFSKIEALTRDSYDVWWWEVEIPTRAPYMLINSTKFTKPI